MSMSYARYLSDLTNWLQILWSFLKFGCKKAANETIVVARKFYQNVRIAIKYGANGWSCKIISASARQRNKIP